jgi:hypothetical protein
MTNQVTGNTSMYFAADRLSAMGIPAIGWRIAAI